jgi:hypothetical protein
MVNEKYKIIYIMASILVATGCSSQLGCDCASVRIRMDGYKSFRHEYVNIQAGEPRDKVEALLGQAVDSNDYSVYYGAAQSNKQIRENIPGCIEIAYDNTGKVAHKRYVCLYATWKRATRIQMINSELVLVVGVTEYTAYEDADGNEILHGRWMFKSAELRIVGYYVDGVPNGIYRVCYGKGDRLYECWYKNGKREGMARWWDRSGKLIAECQFRDDAPWNGSIYSMDVVVEDSGQQSKKVKEYVLYYRDGQETVRNKETGVTSPVKGSGRWWKGSVR